jgi:AraC-like DNA-binding protein
MPQVPEVRTIAEGKGWSISEFVCHAGPQDRPYEEQHEGFMIAAVVEGSFLYKTDTGRDLLHPGAFVLGNSGKCFQCGHDHSYGDRCLAFRFSGELFEEIASAAAGTMRYRFQAPALPVEPKLMPLLAAAEETASEEIALRLAANVLSLASGYTARDGVSAGDERRVASAVRFIEENSSDDVTLEGLARIAGLSKFHFLRTFRRAVGLSPYQFVLNQRMRRAAHRLASSSDPVSAVAFAAGFGDLSTFNRRFRSLFGVTPVQYRTMRTTP